MENPTLMPAPRVNPENRAFWDAAVRGSYVLKKCTSCSKAHYYPRAMCPFCHSAETEWVESAGEGVVYSFSVMRRENPVTIPAYVELQEGIKVLTTIVGCAPEDVRIGMPVKVDFADAEGGVRVPVFKPA